MSSEYERCLKAAEYIKSLCDPSGSIGIVLGSGLGELADEISDPCIIKYTDIPGFPSTTVTGHEGKLIFGNLSGKKVLCMKGRYHYYEGHDIKTVVMPIRVMKLLGVRFVILTNAAGGVNLSYKPGTLMFIDDFINYMGINPLLGINEEEFGTRFPDMTKAIDPFFNDKAKQIASKLNIETKSGVYMSFSGPSFETPAEIRFARIVGADAIGMSTVPEIIAARHCNLPLIGISCITNMAAGITGEELTVEEVNITANKVKNDFKKLVRAIIEDC